MPTPSGWNHNLTKRCVKATRPGLPNYYEDTQQCDTPPIPGIPTKHWAVAIQSGKTVGIACPEPESQSFPINAGGPLTLGFVPHTDESGVANWSVNLKTDFNGFSHPCGSEYFTWYMFMDHLAHGGGPLPTPDRLVFSAVVNYNDFCPNGGTRALAMFHGYWNGKHRTIELHFQSTNWADGEPGNPIIQHREESESLQYLAVHGQYFGIQPPKGQDAQLTVPWHGIINSLISYGYLPAPAGEWSTQAIGIGHESFNLVPSLAVVANLWFTNFRIVEI